MEVDDTEMTASTNVSYETASAGRDAKTDDIAHNRPPVVADGPGRYTWSWTRARIGIVVLGAAALVGAVVFGAWFWTSSHSVKPPLPPSTSAARPPAPPTSTSAALAKLATLPIKGRAPKTGYARSLFGAAWTDDVTVAGGHNGCNTRDDILQHDLVAVEIKPRSHGCIVLSGILHDPYSGTVVTFHRGRDTSSQVQIDHVVPLLDAWQKGAQQWDTAKLRNFANDPINLQATIGSMNEQKRASDAATWLPPNKSYRCTYVSRIVDVKAAYGLWVTQAEHDAIARTLTQLCVAP